MKKFAHYFLSGTASLVLVLLFFSGCSSGKAKQAARVVPVVAEKAEVQNVPLQIKAIGNVEPYNSVQVKALVGGEVQGVYFREGQDVKKGDLLFKIDARPYEAALRQAEAALARDAAQAKNAEEQAKRYAILVQKDYVPRDQYDQMKANAEAMSAAVEADKATVETARLNLAYCTIKSSINGRAGGILVNAGNMVKANDLVMTTINQIQPMYVTFSIPEQNLADVKKYTAQRELRVEALIPGDEKRPARGELTFIDNAVNTTTGTIKLKGTFANQDRRLWPGQFMDVILTLTTEPNRVVVPSQAVQTGQQGQYVYVVKTDMTADLRVVGAGRIFQNWMILEKGVAAGEQVVTDGQLRLTPGVKVEIKNGQVQEAQKTSAQNADHGGKETQKKDQSRK
jgi:multidrug efflux system membrane fusion protein